MSPATRAALPADPPGLRWIETIVAAAADGLKPSLVAQLKLIAGDLKRLGATDHHVSHAMKALIEEIATMDRASADLRKLCVAMIDADDPDEHAAHYNAIVDLMERAGLVVTGAKA